MAIKVTYRIIFMRQFSYSLHIGHIVCVILFLLSFTYNLGTSGKTYHRYNGLVVPSIGDGTNTY